MEGAAGWEVGESGERRWAGAVGNGGRERGEIHGEAKVRRWSDAGRKGGKEGETEGVREGKRERQGDKEGKREWEGVRRGQRRYLEYER